MSVASSYAKALYGAAPDRTEFEAEFDSMIAVLASSQRGTNRADLSHHDCQGEGCACHWFC